MGRGRFALATLIGLAACSSDDSWFGASEDPPLPGERVSVMLLEREVNADPSLANLPIQLPPPHVNDAWPQNGGNPTHVMNHLAAGDHLGLAWRTSIGEGSPGEGQLLARPVISGGRVFTMDGEATIRAFDARSGASVWQLEQDDADGLIGGGLAYADGRLFATLSSGDVVGLDAAKGTEVWRQSLGLPLRAPPTVAEDHVLVLTADNQLYALDAASGRPLWRHAGFFEGAGLLGGPSPAVDRGLVVVPYSSAEVYAIRLDNGRPLWSDTVERPRRTQALDQITDIEAMPVIDGEDVYVAGYGGQMAAIDARRGIRRWDIDIASTETPVGGRRLHLSADHAWRGGRFAARRWPDPLGQSPAPAGQPGRSGVHPDRLVRPDSGGRSAAGGRLPRAGDHHVAVHRRDPRTPGAARPRGGPAGGRRRHRLHRDRERPAPRLPLIR